MAIRKKTNIAKVASKTYTSSTHEQSLVLCCIYKMLQQIQTHCLALDDLVDESILVRNLAALGMPRRFVSGLQKIDIPKFLRKTKNTKKDHQLKWLSYIVFEMSLSTLMAANFYQNIRTLAKNTKYPRLYSRLYLFCYLKQVSEPFSQIVDELNSDYGNNGDSKFVLLNIIGISESDINKALVENDNSEQGSDSLLVNQDESIHCQDYSCINIREFLANIELPQKFISVIRKHPKLNSVEQLIRQCYQLNNQTELTPKDFSAEQFIPLYQYLDNAISFKERGVNILLHGDPGVGKTELVKTLANALECDLFDISQNSNDDRHSNLSQSMASELLRTQVLCEQLDNIILLVDECDDFFYESISSGRGIRKHQINQILEHSIKPTIWITNRPHSLEDAYVRRFDMVLEITSPEPESYEKKVRQLSKGLRLSSEYITHICCHDNLAIAHIEKAIKVTKTFELTANEAQEQMTMLLNGYLIAGDYTKLKEHQKNTQLDYDLSLTNCIGHDLKAVQKGIHRLGECRVLLYGPPGTGKSAYAKNLAEEIGMPLITKSASALLGKYVGDTEKNIAAAFEEAKASNAVLLLDEVDSFLNSREGHQQSWESTMVNEMLTQMESFEGVFIATTNFNKKLDHAVARRFDFKIKLDYLTTAQRLKMFKQFVPSLSNVIQVHLEKLNNLTPGDFLVAARKCALLGKLDEQVVLNYLQQESAYKRPKTSSIGFL
ncbi:MAG: ATP-binding protein [Colwellia sp.]|nr:ATP-binding protein [Colwellia sp.]